MTATLSVLLCINKPNPWWQEALGSVLTQTDPDFELLIAANACTDEFWEILKEATKGDARIRLYRTRIGQLSFNLNFLADKAEGDYLVRMDADDVSESNRIAVLRKFLTTKPVDILGSAVLLIDEAGKSIGRMTFPASHDEILRVLKRRTVFCHPAVTIRKQFLFEIRGYLGGFHSEDTDLWIRAGKSGASMHNLPEALLRYRVHGGQSIASRQGYAEVSGHWLRELLMSPSWYNFNGFFNALVKSFISPFLPGIRRYRRSNTETSE